MTRCLTLRVLLPLTLGFAAPALAQEPAPAEDVPAESEAAESDIVVRALRLRADEEMPIEVSPTPGMGRVSRKVAADSARFTECAGLPRPALLHRIVDGRPETGEADNAHHQHVLRNAGCYKGLAITPPYPDPPHFGECHEIVVSREPSICRVHYERGAIYEEVLRRYAPDLRLSRSNTFDKATRERFRTREEARNAGRHSGADDYFFIVSCMVQLRPEFALALLREEAGSEREGRLRAMMINDGAACVGLTPEQLERVEVDPGQFRAFLAEAVYSWAVAVRRADTLLPPAEKA